MTSSQTTKIKKIKKERKEGNQGERESPGKPKKKRQTTQHIQYGKRGGDSFIIDYNYYSLLYYFLQKMERYNFGEPEEKTLGSYQFFIIFFSPTKHS